MASEFSLSSEMIETLGQKRLIPRDPVTHMISDTMSSKAAASLVLESCHTVVSTCSLLDAMFACQEAVA